MSNTYHAFHLSSASSLWSATSPLYRRQNCSCEGAWTGILLFWGLGLAQNSLICSPGSGRHFPHSFLLLSLPPVGCLSLSGSPFTMLAQLWVRLQNKLDWGTIPAKKIIIILEVQIIFQLNHFLRWLRKCLCWEGTARTRFGGEVGMASAGKSIMAAKASVPGKCSESKGKPDQVTRYSVDDGLALSRGLD